MAQERPPDRSEGAGVPAKTPPDGSPPDTKKARTKRWHERTSVTLCVAVGLFVVALGFVHIITGVLSPLNLPFDIVPKESFGYRETLVDANKIRSLPYVAARIKYPLGCKALQRRDYLPSGREFEAAQLGRQRENLSRWQIEFERSLHGPKPSWQEQLRGESRTWDHAEDANAYNHRGILFARQGQFEGALGQFSRAIQRHPTFVDAYMNRALVYTAIGNLGQAVSDFTQVAEIRPGCADAHRQCGRLQLAMSQYDEAVADLEKAVEIDAADAETHFLLALACYVQGGYARAWQGLDKLQAMGHAVPAGFVMALHQASGHSGPFRRADRAH